jgi:hypothetical protein
VPAVLYFPKPKLDDSPTTILRNTRSIAMHHNSPSVMRPAAAAELLSLSVQRLARMRLEGGGPAYIKAGRSILYRRDALDDWLAAHCRRSTSDTGLAA